MKKIFYLFIILVTGLGFVLAGCSGSDEDGAGERRTELTRNDRIIQSKCVSGQLCLETEDNDAACGDGEDNDSDASIDCDDSDCRNNIAVTVCSAAGNTGENTAGLCQDGADNDSDGVTDCGDSECASFARCRSTGCANGRCQAEPELRISEPQEDPINLSSLFNDVPNENMQTLTAVDGAGPYVWSLVASESAPEGYLNEVPSGIAINIGSFDEETHTGTAVLSGTPHDATGSYAFRARVAEQNDDSKFYEVGIRVRLVSRIVIDVQTRNDERLEWSTVTPSTQTHNDDSEGNYSGNTQVSSLTVAAGTSISLVARGSVAGRFTWCLDNLGNCSSSDADVSNNKVTLSKTSGRKTQNLVAKQTGNRRYLLPKPAFRRGRVNIIVHDESGNQDSLTFNVINFECGGMLRQPPGGNSMEIKGNMYGIVRKTIPRNNLGGSGEFEHQTWELIDSVIMFGPIFSQSLPIRMSSNRNNVNFGFGGFEDPITLREYLTLLDADYLAKATLKVTDNLCGGSARWEIKYKLTDEQVDGTGVHTADHNDHLYLDQLGDNENEDDNIKIKTKFDEVFINNNQDAKMTVYVGKATGGSACPGEGLTKLAKQVFDLNECSYDNEICNTTSAGQIYRPENTVDDISDVCVKIQSVNTKDVYDSDRVDLESIKLITKHWKTTYTNEFVRFAAAGQMHQFRSGEMYNITSDFIMDVLDLDSAAGYSFLDVWKLRNPYLCSDDDQCIPHIYYAEVPAHRIYSVTQ